MYVYIKKKKYALLFIRQIGRREMLGWLSGGWLFGCSFPSRAEKNGPTSRYKTDEKSHSIPFHASPPWCPLARVLFSGGTAVAPNLYRLGGGGGIYRDLMAHTAKPYVMYSVYDGSFALGRRRFISFSPRRRRRDKADCRCAW